MIKNTNDYAVLFDKIAETLSTENAVSPMFEQTAMYDDIRQYDSNIEKLAHSMCVYFDVNIPGNAVDRVYLLYTFVKGIDSDIIDTDGYYRVNDKLIYLMNLNAEVLKESSLDLKTLAEFIKYYRLTVSGTMTGDEYTKITDKQLLSVFGTFDLVYRTFAPTKEVMLKLADSYGVNFCISKDNMVYENLKSLLTNRAKALTEARVIRAFKDGLNNVQPNNVLQARCVPGVQETND